MTPCLLALLLFAETLTFPPNGTELFEKAVMVQTPAGNPPVIVDFQADLIVSLHERSADGKVSVKEASVTEFWKKKGTTPLYCRILRAQKTTTLCSNGRSFLMWEEGSPPRDLRSDPALQKDLDQLKTEIRRTDELLRVFFLANLKGEGVSFELQPKELRMPLETGKEVEVQLVTRKKRGEGDLVLVLGKTDSRLYGVEFLGTDPTVAPERFRFEYHRPWKYTDAAGKTQECLMPMLVRYFIGDEEQLQAKALKPEDLKFNTNLSDKVFEPRRQ